MTDISISLAPIQGITDYIFRNLFFKHFNGLRKAYTPFVQIQDGGGIKKSRSIDLLPENNNISQIVPQILSKNEDEIVYFADYASKLGYSEINWNLGCPFPMVAKRKMGSGLLPYPEEIDKILEQVFHKIKIGLSVKMRLGYSNSEEVFPILRILEKYPISEIIIHPRLGKQMYKGSVNLEIFEECILKSMHKIAFNGDINQFDDFVSLQSKYKAIDHWMIGRGAISNPFLIEEIFHTQKNISNRLERFSQFHNDLFESYERLLSGPGHLFAKMLQLWEYFSKSFENPHKVFKMIKKANSTQKYQNAVHEIFNEYTYLGENESDV